MKRESIIDDECPDLGDIARVSLMAVRLRRFLAHIESAYLFLAFMLGFIAISEFTVGLGEVLGLPASMLAPLGGFAGLVLSGLVYTLYARRIFRFTGNKYRRLFSSVGEIVRYNLLAFASWALVVGLVEYVNPEALNVVWFPGLSLMFIVFYLAKRDEVLFPHFLAGLIMLPIAPLVIAYASQRLAWGGLLLAYYVAGVYSLREAVRAFEEES